MLIHDAIVSNLYPYDVDENLILKACIDCDVFPEDEYSVEARESVARATIYILANLISLSSESDSGYSLSYNVDKLKERICFIARSNGLADIADEYDNKPKVYIIS